MYQYLQITCSECARYRFLTNTRKKRFLFYLKQLGIIFFAVYAVMFLAVTTPFLPQHSLIIYILGALCIVFLISKLIVQSSFEFGSQLENIIVQADGMFFNFSDSSEFALFAEIEFYSLDLFGIVRTNGFRKKIKVPLHFFDCEMKNHFLSYFIDLVPARTEIFEKLREVIEALFVALMLAVHIIYFIAQNYYIPSGSMKNTLMVGDHLFAEKVSYGIRFPQIALLKDDLLLTWTRIRAVKRGDVVIFAPPGHYTKDEYIKRVIATEGDDFDIANGHVILNGERLDEPYATGETQFLGDENSSIVGTVPANMVVVLGDNRMDSQDSRFFGYVPVRNIKARAFFVYFNAEQMLKGNFSRFGVIR